MKNLILAILFLTAALSSQKASSSAYGVGCNNNGISMSPPKLGSVANIKITNNDAPAGILGLGTQIITIPLGNDCFILLNPLQLYVFTSNGGKGFYKIPIPNQPSLAGFKFYVQALSFDSKAFGYTEGIEGIIGW